MIGSLIATLALGQPQNFVTIKAGSYRVGKFDRLDSPVRNVTLKAFQIATYETTNEQFEAFVKATGYVTDAEKYHNAMVFQPGLKEFRWIRDETAYWRFPNGKSRGGIDDKMNHPVTSISFHDGNEYCKWLGVRLPTLNEWEVACRAGTKTEYYFGDDVSKIGQYANVWHGRNHLQPEASDGFMLTAPVGSFLPNQLGLYDMYGNVFEFCSGSLPSDKKSGKRHSRGGSWWCSKNSCCFFNSVDIGSVSEKASFSNQGFRIAK